jgi:proton-dependent oligopeptide transporter, POT family
MDVVGQNDEVRKHPKGFYVISFIEIWERFGYGGLHTVLALFLTKNLGMSDAQSFTIYGTFVALVYAFMSVGGYIGDKVLGTQRTIILGAATLMLGYFIMGLAGANITLIYAALAIVAVGNGLFKANPSSLLSKIYLKDDPRLDGAFTIYYMAINVGFLISMIAIPYLGGKYGATFGFYICGGGVLLAIATFIAFQRLVKGFDSPVGLEPINIKNLLLVAVGIIITVIVSTFMLQNITVVRYVLLAVGITVVGIFMREIFKSQGNERNRLIAAFILILEAIVFYTLSEQMPMSLNFFAIRNVEHAILGIPVGNPQSFQALNPFFIMLLSPLLAWAYTYFGKQGRDLSIATKFAIGMICCSFSFLILPYGAKFANAQGIVSSNWLLANYFFSSLGELLISGLGLAMVAKLVPQRIVGFVMGSWFLSISAAGVIGGWVASLTAAPKGITDPLQTLPVYSNVFLQIGVVVGIVALIMLVTAPKIKHLIEKEQEVKSEGSVSEE